MPKNYPTGISHTTKEKQEHKIFDDEIMCVVANDLTGSAIENKIDGESSWADGHVLTNNSQDRMSINCVKAKSFAGTNNQLVVVWLKNSDKTVPESFKDSLRENYKDLICVCVSQAPSVSLDN